MMLVDSKGVDPATDEDVRMVMDACLQYLEDLDRAGVGPDRNNLYQEHLLRVMGERMPAILARLELSQRVSEAA